MRNSLNFLVSCSLLLGICPVAAGQSLSTDGYYKDIFMDSGINVTSREDLPASRYLGLSIESFISAPHAENQLTLRDTLLQREIICGSKMDLNGILLYPDGSPRFRMIYMNGGQAGKHGNTLTAVGRERMRKFIENGGSYVGTCAGAYLASMGVYGSEDIPRETYLHIWPGLTKGTRLPKNYTAIEVTRNSPLLGYSDFGGDLRIDSVYHNGGCYLYSGPGEIIPEGTEILATYIYDTVSKDNKVQIHQKVAAWAYKKDKNCGRVVVIGSHPESVVTGERLELMAAMIRYAIDGNGVPAVKGILTPEDTVYMNKGTEDNDPSHTCIGDRQYHHFKIDVPEHTKKMTVSLDGYEGKDNFDLSLLANYGSPAFHNSSVIKNVSLGCSKKLTIDNPSGGIWFVSVFCETTVCSRTGEYGTEYFGRTDVLNGVPYKISIAFE